MAYYQNPYELRHHGVLGMHWGVRRYQPYPVGHKGGKEVGAATRVQQRTAVKTAKSNYKQANKNYSKSFNKAYNYSSRHPVSQYVGKKQKSKSSNLWGEAYDNAKAANKAKADYKQAKKNYRSSTATQRKRIAAGLAAAAGIAATAAIAKNPAAAKRAATMLARRAKAGAFDAKMAGLNASAYTKRGAKILRQNISATSTKAKSGIYDNVARVNSTRAQARNAVASKVDNVKLANQISNERTKRAASKLAGDVKGVVKYDVNNAKRAATNKIDRVKKTVDYNRTFTTKPVAENIKGAAQYDAKKANRVVRNKIASNLAGATMSGPGNAAAKAYTTTKNTADNIKLANQIANERTKRAASKLAGDVKGAVKYDVNNAKRAASSKIDRAKKTIDYNRTFTTKPAAASIKSNATKIKNTTAANVRKLTGPESEATKSTQKYLSKNERVVKRRKSVFK